MAEIRPRECRLKTGDSILIRHAIESDALALRDCTAAYLQDNQGMTWEPGEFQPSDEQERAWIRGMLDHPDELLLVAEHRGRIIGNIDFQVGKRRRLAHAGEFGMAVLPPWRQQGVGSALLERLIEWARTNPRIEKLTLRTLGSNAGAIALYRKLGFIEEGRLVRGVRYADGHSADTVLMALFVR